MGQKSRRKREAREQLVRERQPTTHSLTATIEEVRKRYARDWSEGHAAKFAADGHYQWMAGFVSGRPLVLEVGTGDGTGTLALIANGATVVSIESNPHCLERAYQNLTLAGVSVSREDRGTITVNDANMAQIRWGKVTSSIPTRGVLLLGGDMLADEELKSWLRQLPGFDAVVCWNMGASAIENTAAKNEEQYRLRVQNKVYDLADQVLKSGGLLHIVDRGRDPLPGKENEQRAVLIESHQDQASTTSLQVSSHVETRSYTPPPKGSGVNMIAHDTSTYAYDPNKGAFWSIVVIKP